MFDIPHLMEMSFFYRLFDSVFSKYIISFILFFAFVFGNQLNAQEPKESKSKKSFWSYFGITPLGDTTSINKSGFFFSPIIYYTPDTRLGGGGAAVYSFHIQDKEDTLSFTRTSYIRLLANYTMNKQTDVWTDWNIFTRNENFLLKGEFRFRNFPDRFYGIGNNTSLLDEERYTYNLLSFKSLLLRKLRDNLFLGLDYHLESEYGFSHELGGQLGDGSIIGYNGGIGSAIGFVSIFDNRDNVLNAYKGQYAEISSYFYTKALGSTFSFSNLNLMYINYFQFRPKHIIAWQTKGRFTFGDVPFLDLSTLGSDDILRGYPKNRFRDNHFVGTQVEYRFPLFWRFGMAAFTGVGDIFSNPTNVSWNTLKYTVGAGLRFVVNSAERVNLRFDYGYGAEGGYFYFSVTEAF